MATGQYSPGAGAGGGAGSDTTAIHDDEAGEIAAITEKVSPIAADLVLIEDSAAGNVKKRVQLSNLPGSGAAPLSAQYVVVALDGTLTGERRIQAEATVLALTDGGANGDLTVSVAANGITDAKLRQGSALSLVGRTANSVGDVANIAATAATDAVMREAGSTIGWGTVATAGIANDAVTFAKTQNIATDRLVGRDTAATGDMEELTVTGGVEFSGAGGIQRSALTGDVTASAGSNATVIANDAVTYAKLQNVAGFSVVGKASTGAGDAADITAADETVLGRTAAGNVAFAQVATGQIANDAVTYAKIQNVAGFSVPGKATTGSGDAADITATATGQAFTNDGTTLAWRLLEDIILANMQFEADTFENPTTADWSVNALAPIAADGVNSGVKVRLFDDTTDEGVGFSALLPSSTTRFRLRFKSKGVTAPAGTRTVGLSLRFRRMQDNTAVAAWVTHALTDISIPTNALMQDDSQAIAYATPSTAIVAGSYYQFELVRTAPSAGTELVGDWALKTLVFEALL